MISIKSGGHLGQLVSYPLLECWPLCPSAFDPRRHGRCIFPRPLGSSWRWTTRRSCWPCTCRCFAIWRHFGTSWFASLLTRKSYRQRDRWSWPRSRPWTEATRAWCWWEWALQGRYKDTFNQWSTNFKIPSSCSKPLDFYSSNRILYYK